MMIFAYVVTAVLAASTPTTARWIPRPWNLLLFEPSPQIVNDFPDPNLDPFYQAPDNIATYANGAVVRSRQVITLATGRESESYQVFYRTTDNFEEATGSLASIWVPATPSWPPKILSWQSAEDSLNLDCAPSWAWVNSSSVMEASYSSDIMLILWALEQGYYVVSPDAEGLKSAWLVGLIEGHAVLDGIRATINHLRLPTDETQIALGGYSGGAHESVWASSLAESYAPDLKIVGAAFGGTPIDLRVAFDSLNISPGSALGGGGLIGLANGYPEFNATINSLLTPNGSATIAKLRAPNNCILATLPVYAGFDFNTLYTSKPLDNHVISAIIANESLLANVSNILVPVPRFPRFQWHGTGDNTVPYAPETQYVAQQCEKGADIRFVSLPGADHGPADLLGIPGAVSFIRQAFEGTLEDVACGTNITIPTIGSSEAREVLGYVGNVVLAAELAAELAAAAAS